MPSKDEIHNYPTTHPKIKEWLLKLTPNSQRDYIRQIIDFERESKQTLEQLLSQLNTSHNPTLILNEIRTLIISTNANKTNSIQILSYYAIASFFKYYGYRLPENPIKHQEPDQNKRKYTKPELQSLHQFLPQPLEQLFTTIGSDSGLRGEHIIQLTWDHIQYDYNNRTDSIYLQFEPRFRKGRKKVGYTFIGTRSRQLLNNCIEAKIVRTQPHAKLFPFQLKNIRQIVTRAKAKARLDPNIPPLHGLRYTFKAALESTTPTIDSNHQKMLMGHFNDTQSKTYADREITILRNEYERAYHQIDYLNNAPDTTQQLSTKQTEQQDIITKLNQRLQNLENTLAQRTNDDFIQRVNQLLDQATHEQRMQFYEKIMKNLLTEPNASKLIQWTKAPTITTPQENKPKPIE